MIYDNQNSLPTICRLLNKLLNSCDVATFLGDSKHLPPSDFLRRDSTLLMINIIFPSRNYKENLTHRACSRVGQCDLIGGRLS